MAIKRRPKAKPSRNPAKSADLPHVRTAQLADLFGVGATTIGEWAAAGIVAKVALGKFDLERSIKGWAKFMRAARAKATSASISVAAERAGLLSVQRRKGELELSRAKGDLVSRAEIMEEFDQNMKHVQLQLSMLRLLRVVLNPLASRL